MGIKVEGFPLFVQQNGSSRKRETLGNALYQKFDISYTKFCIFCQNDVKDVSSFLFSSG